jgi:hypothetical protein
MAGKLRKLRRQAFLAQQGRCFYCSQPVWEEDADAFVKRYGIRERVSKYVQCTAEHLCARQDQGRDVRDNIVAACLWCNQQRHRGRQGQAPVPEVHQARVRALVAQGKWHPVAVSMAALQARPR